MNNLKHLLAGFTLGLVMAIAPSCGGSKCTPSSCPTGCCDDKGQCQDGRSNGACGQLGNTCTACLLGQSCNLGTCMLGSNIGGGSGNTGGGGGTTGGGGGSTGGGGGMTGGGGGMTGGGGGTTGGGGGTTGGGGGTTGGGGGGTCDGCYFNGSCIIKANSGNDTLCGQGGVQCATCSGGAHCVNYTCSGGTGGGGGTTGGGGGTTGGGGGATGGGGGTTVTVGSPCTTTSQCSSLGAGAFCKLQTAPFSGNAPTPYASGFCTLPCTGTCPGSAVCAGGVSSYPYMFNEVDRFCTPSCQTTSNCTAGFQCIPVEPLTGTSSARGCFLSLASATFTGGGLPSKAGQPCTTDSQCGSPPDPVLSWCVTAADGFPNGYCMITSILETSGAWCQSGGRSMAVFPLADGGTTYNCVGSCTTVGQINPGGRTGYSCFGNNNGTGNVLWPSCTSNTDCGGSVPYCNAATGFCCTTTAYTSCAQNF
ncbi:MAG: hypothetical protein ACOZQL_15860 [Myxococcota bacterium]